MRAQSIARDLVAILALTLLATAVVASTAGKPTGKAPKVECVPGRILVGFATGISVNNAQSGAPIAATASANNLNAKFGIKRMDPIYTATSKRTMAVAGLRRQPENAYVISFSSSADPVDVAAAYAKLPGVRYAEPDYIRHALRTDPDDPYWATSNSWGQGYRDQWDMELMGCPAAWDLQQGSRSVVIAVTDTGVDYNHPDLAANMWHNPGEIPGNGIDDDGNGKIDDYYGYDFYNNDADPMDDNGHGTHVAGTIGAVGNNALGISGVNWLCSIMAVKGLNSNGSGSDSTLAVGIIYAADEGANVINMSWGGSGFSQTTHDALAYAHDVRNCVLVVAGGNSNINIDDFSPAMDNNVITVEASDPTDAKCSFSNWGIKSAVTAPGGGPSGSTPPCAQYNCLSLRAGTTDLLAGSCGAEVGVVGANYYRLAGTSMACPHVSGLAGLILAQHPTWTNEQVRQAIQMRADDVQDPGFDRYSGFGRINAYRSVTSDEPMTAFISSPSNGTSTGGNVVISGTAAGPNFSEYTLDYGAGYEPASWTPLAGSTTPVTNGTLTTWDTSSVAPGMYTLRLRTTGTGAVQNAEYRMEITVVLPAGSGHFTEQFTTSPFDLANVSLIFTPDGSAGYYSLCKTPIASLPTNPNGGTALSLTDDSYAQVNLSGASQVSLYGNARSTFYVGSNGYITLDSGDSSMSGSTGDHFALKRMSAFFDDLNPPVGSVTWKQLSDRAVVTYLNVPEYGTTDQNTFQIEMYYDGRIVISYLTMEAVHGLVGISAGMGVPDNFQASDLSAYGSCVFKERALRLAQPGGGEWYQPGQTAPIQWTATGSDWLPGDTVALEYSSDNGTTWNPIAGASGLAYDGGPFDWVTSGLPPSTQYKARVAFNGDPTINSTSDFDFTIMADTTPPAIAHTALQDTGNRTGPYNVCALVTDNLAVASVTLSYSINGGSFTSIPMTASGTPNQYCGAIPGPGAVGDQYCYHIDASDTAATPNTARLPASGEYCFNITACSTDTLGDTTDSSVGSLYARGNVFTCTTTMMLTQIEHYLSIGTSTELRFLVYESTTLNGTYDKIFEKTVTDSGTGAAWYGSGQIAVPLVAGKCYVIAAAWEGSVTYYCAANGHPVAVAFGQSESGFALYDYPPPSTVIDPAYLYMYVYNQRLTTCPLGRAIIIAQPNGGELYEPGQTALVQWSAVGADWTPGDTIALEYSSDGGANWIPIQGASNLAHDAGSFEWDTTGLPGSTQYRVRATFNGDSAINDMSDADFTIMTDTTPPVITHTPLSDTRDHTGPYLVCAQVTDDRGVGGVNLYWSVDGGPFASVPMTVSGAPDQYCGVIPGGTAAQEHYCYYIEAADVALIPNVAQLPARGDYCFNVLDCRPPAPSNPGPADGASGVFIDTQLTWVGGSYGTPARGGGVYGVLESAYSGNDVFAVAHINGLPGLSASILSWATLAASTGPALREAYDVIYFPVDPAQSDYDQLRAAVAPGGLLDVFTTLGGVLVLNVAGNSWNQDNIAPGGLDYNRATTNDAETFPSPSHPYITGIGYAGTPLTEAMFADWVMTDHGTLDALPAGSTSILLNASGVSMAEYPWGSGKVIVSSVTFGSSAWGPEHSAQPFDNELLYAASYGGGVTTYDVYMGSSCDNMTKVGADLSQPTLKPGVLRTHTTYHWRVVAKSECGQTEGPCWSFGTESASIAKPADGVSVEVRGAVVTAAFPGVFYIETDTREAGIRVQQLNHGLAVGSVVKVAGPVRTNANGERYIDASDVYAMPLSLVISPLGVTDKALGGGDWHYDAVTKAGQKGVTGGAGLNNIGLLVTIAGVVTASGDTWMYVDDGSRVSDGTGTTGVRCEVQSGVIPPAVGAYVDVIGISSCELHDSSLVRVLLVRGQSDINELFAAPQGQRSATFDARPRDRTKPH